MDIERAFVSKVALTGQIDAVLAEGISEEHFGTPVISDIYAFMAQHSRTYHAAPSMAVLREKFEDFKFEAPTDALAYLTERFKRHVKKEFAMSALVDLAEYISKTDELDDVESLFLEQSRRLSQLVPTATVARFSDIDERIDKYEKGQDLVKGIKYGIPEIDRATLGIQPHELVTIAGWQGLGKSTLAQFISFNAWRQNKNVLMFSLEMEGKALLRKWDTMLTNFSYYDLKAHELSAEDIENWRKKAMQVKGNGADIIIKDKLRSCTPDTVYGEIVRYQPHLVVVDYITLMDTPRSTQGTQHWQEVTAITKALKQIARATTTPIIAVAQTNANDGGTGATLSNIAYSRSIGQDSDTVIGLAQDDEMKANSKMEVKLIKNRDGENVIAPLSWNMSRMKFEPWNEEFFFKNRAEREKLKEVDGHIVDTETGEIIEDS